MRRRATVGAAVVTLLAGGAVAFGAIPTADGNIYACYSTGDGTVRVKSDLSTPCPKGWSPLKWAAGQPDVPQTTTYTVRVDGDIDDALVILANCNRGDVVTGGGFDSATHQVDAYISAPISNAEPQGWRAVFLNEDATDRTVSAFAVCQHTG